MSNIPSTNPPWEGNLWNPNWGFFPKNVLYQKRLNPPLNIVVLWSLLFFFMALQKDQGNAHEAAWFQAMLSLYHLLSLRSQHVPTMFFCLSSLPISCSNWCASPCPCLPVSTKVPCWRLACPKAPQLQQHPVETITRYWGAPGKSDLPSLIHFWVPLEKWHEPWKKHGLTFHYTGGCLGIMVYYNPRIGQLVWFPIP